MLTIRLNRTGKRNRPYFRVVLQEQSKAPGKRHVEILGSYDSMKKIAILKKERILYWQSQGVKLSDTVYNLLVREGVIEGKKRVVKIAKPVAKEEALVAETPAAESEKKEEVKAEAPEVATPVKSEEATKEAVKEEVKPETESTPAVPEETKTEEKGEEVKA